MRPFSLLLTLVATVTLTNAQFHKFMKGGSALNISSWDHDVMRFCDAYVDKQCGQREDDKVESLPGQPDCDDDSEAFDQYAGYITVDPKAGRALFYYFVEAVNDSKSVPLVLWFNGGGYWESHSSLGHGALMGQGPFRVNSDGETLSPNNYSWNKVANIIFLETPAGVGYSYSNSTLDYEEIGDKKATEDSFAFILNWLQRFPRYKKRDFYIAGDGYAGHCLPQLAYAILHNNKKCNNTHINLKGIAIGNGWMDEDDSLKGVYDFHGDHTLISNDVRNKILFNCNFTTPIVLSPDCLDYLNQASEMVAGLNLYDIYGPPCKPSSRTNISIGGFDTCSHMYVESYLNLPKVQEALHANITSLPYPWTVNSSVIKEWKNWYPTITPLVKKLMANGTRVWLYTGDTDSVAPITLTDYFIERLNVTEQTSSYPWYSEGEVAGFAVGYENLTLVSVRGGGHFVPSYQPARALTLFSSFIKQEMPPRSPH
ncbi:uncharacterized protein A4U43_C08F28920 [Asparagus officinalis]|uniref:serine carboxypeptidase-like 40 n=1 Tax=Asparagus officinalis TaxID=4686 RepID=UPI00098E1E89|nr:serine carboxypeptidase-like 40 [Asparagus officinalis]ONK61347.1 uncharacterized protein A4U43_C08F28920 [Asparagus officinalis]